MSDSQKIQLLKRHYELTSQGLLGIPEQLWADDVKWDAPRPSLGLVGGNGTRQGKQEALLALKESTEFWDKCSVIPDDFYEEEKRVVVVGRLNLEKDGNTATANFFHDWTFSGPTEVAEFRTYCVYTNITGLL